MLLPNGQVLGDVKIREGTSVAPLIPDNFKDLNMVFIIQTKDNIDKKKEAVCELINQVYSTYSVAFGTESKV